MFKNVQKPNAVFMNERRHSAASDAHWFSFAANN